MKRILIVYHSMTGGTRQMAAAAAQGAGSEPEVGVDLLEAREAAEGHVLAAHGYLFATPENLGAMSGMMKDFFDRTYYAMLDKINGRAYAALICAGNDGRAAAQQLERIATGWRLKPIDAPLIVKTHAQSPPDILRTKSIPRSELAACARLGATLASGLALGIF